MKSSMRTVVAAALGSLLALTLAAPLHADDTEIFFGQSNDAFDNNPNILFILDNSGSMGSLDEGFGNLTRMERLKSAMGLLLDQSSSYNVGLMAFQGWNWGGVVRYPIGHLESDSDDLCNGTCSDETVVSRPADGLNDGSQNDSTQAVILNNSSLQMASAYTDTTTTTVATGTQTTDTALSVADVSEYMPTDGSAVINEQNQLYSKWFYYGADGYGAGHYAYRFDQVKIPRNATVISAKITFSQTTTGAQTGDVAAYISAEATPTPTAYPDGLNGTMSLEERRDPVRRTNVLVPWKRVPPDNSVKGTSDDVGAGPLVDTPDLSGLLSELVSLPGWATGNSMSILINPFDSYTPSIKDLREFYGSSATGGKAPILTYTYSEAPDPDLTTTSIDAIAHVDEITTQDTSSVSRNMNNATTELFFAGTANEPRELGLRFDNIAIPSTAIIKNAYLTLRTASAKNKTASPDQWTSVDGTSNGLTDSADEDDTTTTKQDLAVNNSPKPGLSSAESTFAMHIRAELDESPENYKDQILRDRTHTSSFVNWADITASKDTDEVSPDISGLIGQVIGLSDWTSGDSVSLRLSAPENQTNSAANITRFMTSTAGVKPSLQITWEENGAGDSQKAETQTTAIRFSQVHIPPGAQVKTARIVFHSAAANDEPTVLDITGENAPASASFTESVNNLGSRNRTTAQETWTVEPWSTVGNAYYTPDLTRIIQEITDQNDWCGGNALTLFLSGTGIRSAISADANAIKAPTLEVTYAPDSVPSGAYCSNSSIVVSLADSSDDAVQNTTNDHVVVNGMALNSDTGGDGTGDAQLIGLRFRGVNLPKDAAIVSATIQLTSNTDIDTATNIAISVEETDNATGFSNATDNIGDRNWSGPVNWSSNPPVGANEGTFSVELNNLVSNVVSRSGWVRGNSMAFRLQPSASSSLRSFSSFDASDAQAARLIIYFESVRDSPGTRFRDNLKQQVNQLVAEGATPITSSLYEATQYFTGGTVDYGLRRGGQLSQNRYHRVSHPYSYEGGQVSRPSGCTDTNLNSSRCIGEIIMNNSSTATYLTPLESQCQANHIVLLSDGEATSNTAANRIKGLIGTGCDDSVGGSEECGRELSQWLYETDHSPVLPGVQNITTHTIAFNLDEVDRAFLSDLAKLGGGGAYSADSAASLLNAFKTIFINVSKTDTSFVAPSATLNQANRMKNREDLYFAMFKPESTARWNGNLKKYKLQSTEGQQAVIVDQNNQPAVDENKGEFKPGARSFWSSVVDGGSVLLGGAAEQIKADGGDFSSRKVYTYTGTSANLVDASNALLPSNDSLDADWFALPPTLADDADYYQRLVQWTHGQDIQDIDGDQDITEPRAQMGDPMHAQPVLLNYADGTNTKSMIFVATNEGFLHAIDTETGKEEFAFIPTELLKNQHKLLANEPTRRRPYGLDGGMTTWVDDTNNNGVIDRGEKAYLYIGMRRGGSHYYALDVTDISNPQYLWSINGRTNTLDTNDATADGDFVELGDTWSLPVRSQIRDGSKVKDVLIFGGGYDPNQDPAVSFASDDTVESVQTRSIDGIGRAVFIVDATTGKLLWQTNRADPRFSAMNYSIPSDIKVIDIDFDGMADQLYVGDMGGQIWRIDINNDATLTDSLSNRIDAGVIAQLAGDDAQDARRFYYAPDVSIISVSGQQQLAISIGSGWRAHPLDDVINDRFYSLRLPYVYGKPIDSFGQTVYPVTTHTSTGLKNVTNDDNATLNSDTKGWYIDLAENGEKVLSPSITADHKVLFTTYLPETEAVACSAAEGSGAIYAVSVYNGAPVLDLNESGENDLTTDDRSRILNHAGIPPATSLLFPEAGEATVVVGTETLDEFSLDQLRRRTFWQELIEEDS